jgi:hypothetical protein
VNLDSPIPGFIFQVLQIIVPLLFLAVLHFIPGNLDDIANYLSISLDERPLGLLTLFHDSAADPPESALDPETCAWLRRVRGGRPSNNAAIRSAVGVNSPAGVFKKTAKRVAHFSRSGHFPVPLGNSKSTTFTRRSLRARPFSTFMAVVGSPGAPDSIAAFLGDCAISFARLSRRWTTR